MVSRKVLMAWSVALCTCLAVACAGGQGAPSPERPEARAQEIIYERLHPAKDPEPYRMKIGDVLGVKFYYTPELNEEVTIRPDGKISLQLVGDVQAAGLTPPELDDALTERYSGVLHRSEIAVIVKTFAEDKVYVGGEVRRPSVIPLAGRLTALQAIFHAGGFEHTAKRQEVVIIRKGDNDHPVKFLMVDLDNALATGHGDLFLTPFDVVFVPRSNIAKVNLFVRQYINDVIPIAVIDTFQGFLFLEAVRDND